MFSLPDRQVALFVCDAGKNKGVRNLYLEALICFFGRPRGRSVVSNPNDAAVLVPFRGISAMDAEGQPF